MATLGWLLSHTDQQPLQRRVPLSSITRAAQRESGRAAERLGPARGCGDGGLVHSQRWLPLLLLQLQLLPAAAVPLNALTLAARR